MKEITFSVMRISIWRAQISKFVRHAARILRPAAERHQHVTVTRGTLLTVRPAVQKHPPLGVE